MFRHISIVSLLWTGGWRFVRYVRIVHTAAAVREKSRDCSKPWTFIVLARDKINNKHTFYNFTFYCLCFLEFTAYNITLISRTVYPICCVQWKCLGAVQLYCSRAQDKIFSKSKSMLEPAWIAWLCESCLISLVLTLLVFAYLCLAYFSCLFLHLLTFAYTLLGLAGPCWPLLGLTGSY